MTIPGWATSGATTSLGTAFNQVVLPSVHSWEYREKGELLTWGFTPPTATIVSSGSATYLGQAGTDSTGTYAARVEVRLGEVRAFALLDQVRLYPANWSECTEEPTTSFVTCSDVTASLSTCEDAASASYATCSEPTASFTTCADSSATIVEGYDAPSASFSTCDEPTASYSTCDDAA